VVALKRNAPAKVSEFINHQDASWNVAKLNEFFLPMDVEIIRAIPLSHQVQEDFWAWHFEMSGVFLVRSCYRAIMSMKRSRED
jgi:hypothetical protein